MNKAWSNYNHALQKELRKDQTYKNGLVSLMDLREDIWNTMVTLRRDIPDEAYALQPFMNTQGYHNKTIAYCLYHIFRTEDFVFSNLVHKEQEIFIEGDYQYRLRSPIATTGNELVQLQVQAFSKALNVNSLYEYARNVMLRSNEYLRQINYLDLKATYTEEDARRLMESKVISPDYYHLIDLWVSRDLYSLIKNVFSRHWTIHCEAALRIAHKINKRL